MSAVVEEWRPIVAYGIATNYEVSSLGRVRNADGRIKKQSPDGHGYLFVRIYVPLPMGRLRSIGVARIVADAFIRPRTTGEANSRRTSGSVSGISRAALFERP